MKIALYKAKYGGILDKFIDTFSGKIGYSHCEFVFSDGMFFSSSGRDGGVRFKKINPNPEHWICYQFPLTLDQEKTLRSWCTLQLGRKYDFLGVFGMVLPTHHNQRRWFCSEILVAGLQKVGMFKDIWPWKVSPNILYYLLEAIRQEVDNA